MEPDINTKIEALDQKISQIYVSVEKTRKYFLTTMWVTVIMFVLPLIALIFVIPAFISTYTATIGGL